MKLRDPETRNLKPQARNRKSRIANILLSGFRILTSVLPLSGFRLLFSVFCFLISVFWLPASGHAACTSPTGKAADLMYNGDAHVPQYCNGVSWVVMAPTINLPPTNGLVAYWKLDDGSGTSAADSSGNGNTGTLQNSPTWTSGYYNGALQFNGTNQYVSVPDAPSFGLNNFTLSIWVNFPSSPAGLNEFLTDKEDSSGAYYNFGFYYAATNQLECFYNTTTGYGGVYGPTWIPSTNQWYHVVCTYDGANMYLYVNGTQVATAAASGLPVTDSNPLNIGYNGYGSNSFFNGLIDDARVYNRALSAAEVATLYNYHISPPSSGLAGWWKFDESGGTAAADSSGNGNNGAATGTTIVAGQIGNARSFSGTGEWVDAGDPVSGVFDFGAGQDFSFSFWLKRAASSTSEFLFAKGAGGTGDQGYAFILESGDAMKLMLSKTGEGSRLGIYGANITDTSWHHVAVTLSRASLGSIYLDGVLTGSGDISGYNVSLANTGRNLTIGCSSSGSLCFPGTIDDVRLYNRALSADEVYGIYRTGSPVCSTPSGYEGDVMYNKGANHVLQFCDSAGWRPLGPVPGAGGSNCASPTGNEGDTIYSDSGVGSGVMQYCDGTNWIKMGGPNLPTSGLVGYWKLDDGSGTSAADSSGNGNRGTLYSSPVWTTNGKDAGALIMNGYVTVPAAASLDVTNSTISMWVNSSSLPGWLLERYNGSVVDYAIYYDNAAHSWNCGFGSAWINYSQTPPLNQWYHVACTYDGSFVTLYINGQSVDVNSGSGTPATGGALWLGWSQYGTGSSNTTLDDVRVYNRALSVQEIWQLYNGA